MVVVELLFWLSVACVAYTFVGYPLIAAVRSKAFGRPVVKGDFRGSFTVVLAAYNEAANLGRRLTELSRLVTLDGREGRILVVSDGSTDRTVETANEVAANHPNIEVIALAENRGKAVALNAGVTRATSDIVIFADARQTWANDTIGQLLSNFADSTVGAASGDLKLETSPGVLAGVGVYWKFEKWLRRCESRTWSQVGVTGAVSAVRRELFEPIPAGTLLDDVYWPLRVAMSGRRVVHDETAHAFDRLPPKASGEFWRKVRTLAGNYQLASRVPSSLVPFRNPVWLEWVSHKLMRLVAPWALLGALATTIALGWWEAVGVQIVGYSIGLLGMAPGFGNWRLLSAAASFLTLNSAAWIAFWVWLFGRTGRAWRKVDYASYETSKSEA